MKEGDDETEQRLDGSEYTPLLPSVFDPLRELRDARSIFPLRELRSVWYVLTRM